MDELELAQLKKQPKWLAVLEHYHQVSTQLREKSSDFDGWVPRSHEIADLDASELPGIHGKLIAFGFLKFDLTGRDGGIRYQLTPTGKQGISSLQVVAEETATADEQEAVTV